MLLTFDDRRAVMRHIEMISGWMEFQAFVRTVRPTDVRVYGGLPPEDEKWVRQFGVVSKTFGDHVTGLVRRSA